MLTNFQNSSKLLFSAVFITCLITSCAAPKTDKAKAKTDTETQVINQEEKNLHSSQYYLSQAESLPVEQSIPMLVSASEQLLLENENHQALWLANQTSALLPPMLDHQQELSSEPTDKQKVNAILWYRLTLVKSQSLSLLGYYTLAQNQLDIATDIQAHYQFTQHLAYFKQAKVMAEHQSLTLNSVDAQLRIIDLHESIIDDEIFLLWQSLSQLSPWQIKQLSRMTPPNFKAWRQLLIAANKWGDQPVKFNQALNQWQERYPNHAGNIIIPSLFAQNTDEISELTNIAVLLPLSGKQSAAGIVAQQGILAAYENNTDLQIHFIDENTVDIASLKLLFTEKEINFVIGPLLKDTVKTYLAQEDLTLPTLLLNLPDNTELLPHQVALSMRREDEAKQAASSLSQKSYQQPLILSSKTNISKRVAETFSKQWQQLRGKAPEVVYFDSGKAMQDDLKASLGIKDSQQRVNDVKRQFKQKLKVELRNRRDIDMIYLVANPQQTKLLKPYIDVNTSPFSSIIPVYASSLSHSINDDKSDNRDLTGLVFTEIPWLLNSTQQNRELAVLSQTLWPQRTDSLQRIFAMGYDSLFLVKKIPTMQKANYIRHYGQTGVLKLGEDNILTRSLIWGRYRNNKVKEVTID